MRFIRRDAFVPTRAGWMMLVSLAAGSTSGVYAMSANTIVSYMVLATVLGSCFFLYLGLFAERSFFLLLGNMLCIAAHIVFIMMLAEQDGNPYWMVGFGMGALANGIGALAVIKKFREHGCGDDEDSEDESGGEYDSGDEQPVSQEQRMLMDKATRRQQKRAARRRLARKMMEKQD